MTAAMQQTEEKVNTIQRLVENAVRHLLGGKPLPAPAPVETEAHGAKIRSDVVGTALARMDDYLKAHPDHVTNLTRVVDHELVCKALGLAYMRPTELVAVRKWLQTRRKV